MDKPPHGAPCNGCGRCCAEEVCPIGQKLFGHIEGPCDAMEWTVDRFSCGVILQPELYAPFRVAQHGAATMSDAAARLLGAGMGCDSQLDGEKLNWAFIMLLHQPPTIVDLFAASLWDVKLCTD